MKRPDGAVRAFDCIRSSKRDDQQVLKVTSTGGSGFHDWIIK
jgi:hypothetical protein